MNGFDFSLPLVLLALPLPLLARLRRPRLAGEQGGLIVPRALAERFSAGAGRSGRGARRRLAAALFAFGWAALVLALAGPRVVAAAQPTEASGRDIMLALDLSGSMAAEDFEIDGRPASRVDALKHVGEALIRRRVGDRVGLVIFAEKAYAAAPLSFDVEAVARTLREVPLGLVGHSTAIGEGLGLALKRLADSTSPARVVVLLSDGANDVGTTDPEGVAKLARELGVRIYAIGMGVVDEQTFNGLGDPVDYAALQKLAAIGGGTAFRARTTAELEEASRAIERLAAGQAAAPAAIERRELWPFPGALAFILFAGLALLRGRA